MKFTVDRKELAEALNIVSKALPRHAKSPLLECVHLETLNQSTLQIQANNFTLGAMSKIVANVENAGTTCLNGVLFGDMIRKLNSEVVIVEIVEDDKIARITGDNAKFSLLTQPPDEFPTIKADDISPFYAPASMFRELIKRSAFAAGINEMLRPIFEGILLKIEGNKITAAATNTHRIAVATDTFDSSAEDISVIIPAKQIADIAKISEQLNISNQIALKVTEKYMTVEFDNLIFVLRLIDGDFPPFEKVLDINSAAKIEVDPTALINILDRVSVISEANEYNTVNF